MNRAVQASAPGKLVLCGEYAVLEGAPALVMAVERRATVRLAPAGAFTVSAPGFLPEPAAFEVTSEGAIRWPTSTPEVAHRLALFEHVAGPLLRGHRYDGFSAELDTRAFFTADGIKLGLGSSAALTVSLYAALRVATGVACKPPQDMLPALLSNHRGFQQGHGSGVDLAASLFGGTIDYRIDPATGPSVRRITLPDALCVLCVWSGQTASTARFLARLSEWRRRQSAHWQRSMNDLSGCALRAADAVESVARLLPAIDEYATALDQLGQAAGLPVFTERHRRIAELARRHGVVYKPSGAGGGDVGIALTDDQARLDGLKLALEAAGFQCPETGFSNAGLVAGELDE